MPAIGLPNPNEVGGAWGAGMYPDWYIQAIQENGMDELTAANTFREFVQSPENTQNSFGWYWDSFRRGGENFQNQFGGGGQEQPPPGNGQDPNPQGQPPPPHVPRQRVYGPSGLGPRQHNADRWAAQRQGATYQGGRPTYPGGNPAIPNFPQRPQGGPLPPIPGGTGATIAPNASTSNTNPPPGTDPPTPGPRPQPLARPPGQTPPTMPPGQTPPAGRKVQPNELAASASRLYRR